MTALASVIKFGDLYYETLSNQRAKVVANPNGTKYSGSVVVQPVVTSGSIVYVVTEIGSQAFYNCSGLTSVQMHQYITQIDDYAFYGCSGLNINCDS